MRLYSMDIDSVLQILPIPPQDWSLSQVDIWLRIISLPHLASTFQQNHINGNKLLSLKFETLGGELKIQSNIIKKKIMNWIQYLRLNKQYINFALKGQRNSKTPSHLRKFNTTNSQLTDKRANQEQFETMSSESTSTKQYVEVNLFRQYKKAIDHQTLYIYEKCNGQSKFKVCEEKIINFGKAVENDFNIYNMQNISLIHCSIIHRGNRHILSSNSKKEHNWKKIAKRMPILQQCCIEMGETYFEIFVSNQILKIIVKQHHNNYVSTQFNGEEISKVRVGRKNNCQISFPLDTTMSGLHGKFLYQNGCWYFEDLETTNGSWTVCLQEELIQNGFIFRIGKSEYIYECRILDNDQCKSSTSRMSEFSHCKNGCVSQKNCYFRPCYHIYYCEKCANTIQKCPVCQSDILEIIKVYK